jgi:hypothetical protein
VSAEIDRILDGIADLLGRQKELLSDGLKWERRVRAGRFAALELAAPLAIDGVIRDGLQIRLSCRSNLVEQDIHAQLQVYVPSLGSNAHVLRVEWRPVAAHTNNGAAPAKLQFKKFADRWYEFGLNRRLGVAGLQQRVTMIAQPLPADIATFNDLLEFLGIVWVVSGMSRVPTPPWEDRLV